jgi:hypothetical protein
MDCSITVKVLPLKPASHCSARTCSTCPRKASGKHRDLRQIPDPHGEDGHDLEIELGCTGGEEGGVDNSGMDPPCSTPNRPMSPMPMSI